MASLAHLAIYQVCEEHACEENTIVATMKVAIVDVEVLSLSIGGHEE